MLRRVKRSAGFGVRCSMPEDRRLELRVSREFLDRLDAARGETARGTFVKRAVEQALGEAKGSLRESLAGPDPVPSSEGVRPAASARPSVLRSPSLDRFRSGS